MRLDKYLADMGRGTRSELKTLIRKGRVTVDGLIIRDPAFSVTETSAVNLDGSPVRYEAFTYIMLNKPAGVITATADSREKIVVDLLTAQNAGIPVGHSSPSGQGTGAGSLNNPIRRDLFPVGRLDRDTEGLLLLTNDGALAHSLLSPKKHVDKTYLAVLDSAVTDEDIALFESGLKIDDEDPFTAQPAKLVPLSESDACDVSAGPAHSSAQNGYSVLVTIREGKYHQIKRMFAAVGRQVLTLRRLSMGPLNLDETLRSGEWRRLSTDEIEALKGLL